LLNTSTAAEVNALESNCYDVAQRLVNSKCPESSLMVFMLTQLQYSRGALFVQVQVMKIAQDY